jgi:hypothetical protein
MAERNTGKKTTFRNIRGESDSPYVVASTRTTRFGNTTRSSRLVERTKVPKSAKIHSGG